MQKGYIAVFDSGIGGLSVLKAMNDRFSGENFLYCGDNKNAPYGDKSDYKLLDLFISNYLSLSDFDIKAAVLACNTLSLNILSEAQEFCPVKVYGIFPPIEKCIIEKKKTLLLATPVSCKKYSDINYDNVKILPVKNLAADIEKFAFDSENIDLSAYEFYDKKYVGAFERVILGCTHYELIKNKIFNHLKPLKIISGTDDLIDKLSKENICSDSIKNISKNQVIFVGENANKNYCVWKKVVNGF